MSTDAHPTDATTTPPPANGAVAHSPSEPCPSDEELARELVEFEKQFPAPDLNEIRADARWFEEHWGKPELTQYRGSFVAVYNGTVVGHGPNALLLELETAKRLNVHPQRFILEYIPVPDITLPPVNGTAAHRSDEARRADLELVREIAELEKQFPPPEMGALIPDARWFVANASALYDQYRGNFVAVLNGAVIGHGPNALQLQLDVARKYNVHPQSFLVELILPSMFE